MLRTVAECDRALKLLDMERDHILEVRKYLEENGPILFTQTIRPKPLVDDVLQLVIDNPGIDGQTVKHMIQEQGFELKGREVQSALSRLRISGEIENRGRKHGLGSRWYHKEFVS